MGLSANSWLINCSRLSRYRLQGWSKSQSNRGGGGICPGGHGCLSEGGGHLSGEQSTPGGRLSKHLLMNFAAIIKTDKTHRQTKG